MKISTVVILSLVSLVPIMTSGCVSKRTYQHKILDIQRRLEMATKKPYNKMWTDVYNLNGELKDELEGVK